MSALDFEGGGHHCRHSRYCFSYTSFLLTVWPFASVPVMVTVRLLPSPETAGSGPSKCTTFITTCSESAKLLRASSPHVWFGLCFSRYKVSISCYRNRSPNRVRILS